MTATTVPATIRSLFSLRRPIDRPIEKVIDYYATDPARLRAEVEEYEVTESVERNLRRFLEIYGEGVRGGRVTETGIWVSGFYGSGKSSFTKYLGFALDPKMEVDGQPFLDLFSERINAPDIKAELRTLARSEPTAVIMLDLGSEQLATSASAEVSRVLYWKVLQWAGYSREEKLAHLELQLERDGRYAEFQRVYEEEFGGQWTAIHNNPLVAVARADQLVPRFYPQEYPEPGSFRATKFSLALDVRELAREMLDIVRRKSGYRNVLFLIDEVGQYVAPRHDLILNLDGLARNLKELGQGRVWIVATAQQTLTEIVEKAAYNSTELFKLQARFPITIELDARDIREITHRRLLTKSPDGEALLRDLFRRHGQALVNHTRLTGTALFKGDPDEESFARFYPFLPQHFDLLLELVRALARSRGGIGLRSAIRVIQDLLVDASKVLAAGEPVLADQPVGTLATADAFFDTLRADITKEAPHAVAAVDRIARALQGDADALRTGKAIAVLQLLGPAFPRTVENLAALLYRKAGDVPNLDATRAAVERMLAMPEIGLVDDPQAGRLTFLSEKVQPYRKKRNSYVPSSSELALLRSDLLKGLFDPPPQATLEGTKTVRAGIRWGRVPLTGETEEVQIQLESASATTWDERRTALLTETTGGREWQSVIAWLLRLDPALDDVLAEIARSEYILREVSESEGDTDVNQFIRAERRSREANRDQARKLFQAALMDGVLIFRGKATPAATAGKTIEAAAKTVLAEAAAKIYDKYHLVPIRPSTDLAARFLAVERLDRMPPDDDPLKLVQVAGGRPKVDVAHHPALAEALRAFHEKLGQTGTTRLQGSAIQDLFALAPYGWSKDATRYIFAGLLLAQEIVLYTPAGEVTTRGQAAIDALKGTQAFARVGVGVRDAKPSLDALDRAARRLEEITGETVMPLEDDIARVVRDHLPARLVALAGLPAQLQAHGLAGAGRAQRLLDTWSAIMQGDASGAVAILGAANSTFRDDLIWAEKAAKALDEAEEDLRRARRIISEAETMSRYFPSAPAVISDADRAAIDDVLRSESFFDRIPDLRHAIRRVVEGAKATYCAELERFKTDLERAKLTLESLPEWHWLSDDDRSDVVGRLPSPPPDEVSDDNALAALGQLVALHANLPRTEAELTALVRELGKPPIDTGVGETVVDLAELLPLTPLADEAAVELWLEEVRSRLREALIEGRPVRLVAEARFAQVRT